MGVNHPLNLNKTDMIKTGIKFKVSKNNGKFREDVYEIVGERENEFIINNTFREGSPCYFYNLKDEVIQSFNKGVYKVLKEI
jgi:hypothetical protein